MRGRHLRWLAAVAAGALGCALVLAPGAQASTVPTQLSLTGIATSQNPTGGSVLGIHPGDTVTLTAASVPTAGLTLLGLGGLLNSLLGPIVGYRVTADFSGLPGGHAGTVLDSRSLASFTFPKAGQYDFSWRATSLGLLGNRVPVALDLNQLRAAGVAVNASVGYTGQIVVAANPPGGGVGVQLPGISAAPNVGGVQLPTIGVSNATPPPIIGFPASSSPTLPGSDAPSAPGSGAPVASAGPGPGGGPRSAGGSGVDGSPAADGGARVSPGPGVASASADHPTDGSGPSGWGSGPDGSTARSAAAAGPPASTDPRIDLASNRPAPTGVPSALAILAILALGAVSAGYARQRLTHRR